jgi:hypothetical protein
MSEKKYYVVGVTTPEVWDRVHAALTQDGTLDDNIPSEAIECVDLKEHSPTRAVYLMTDEEAEQVSHCPDVKFVDLDQSKYPELFPPRPDEIRCTPTRYTSTVKNYRNFSGLLPGSPNSTDANRAGYQLLRSAQYANPWQGQAVSTIIANTIPNTNTGKDIDLIVGDDGCWFGHADFQNNPTGNVAFPDGYVGGNKLPGGGTCDVLDVVLEGPYYIDPAWFNANPGVRLTTRWDGTTVPVEQVARDWWGNSSARSSSFSTAGTVSIPSYYNRANCNGTKSAVSVDGTHGTPCSGLAYGRTYGWAYNANKWFINAYGNNGLWPVDNYFDVMKIFHNTKPVNPLYGTKDPTISSNSWGFRATVPSTGYYYFRQGTSGSGGVAYTGTKPEFMRYIGQAGDGNRCKGEMLDNNLTTAGDEMVAAGVIFVAAAGNSNQKQVGSSDTDFNNYWSTAATTPLASATHDEFGSTCYNTTSRRGFPQHLGKYTSEGQVVYPTINIGALDDDTQTDGKERKVSYSDMGSQIDTYAPGDGTLSSAQGTTAYGVAFNRYDQTPGGLTSYDTRFSGTSSACPVATGLIATILETNRSWTWSNIRTWLQSLTVQNISTFYQGPDPATATSADWADLVSLMGGSRTVIYNAAVAPNVVASIGGAGLTIGGSGLTFTFT